MQVLRPRSQSSCSAHVHLYPDHPCPRERRWFAISQETISKVVTLHRERRKDEPKMIDDYTYAHNTLRPYQFHLLVGNGTFCVALRVGLEVTQIAYMAFTIGWSTMRLREGVDCVTDGGSQQCFLGLAAGSVEASDAKNPRRYFIYSSPDDEVMVPMFLLRQKN